MTVQHTEKSIEFSSASVGHSTTWIHFNVRGDLHIKTFMVVIPQSPNDNYYEVVMYGQDSGDIRGRADLPKHAGKSVVQELVKLLSTHGLIDLEYSS